MAERVGAIDAWMTICSPETAERWPESFWHIFRKYGVEDRFRRGFTLDEIIAEMDEAGVDLGVASAFKFLDTWVVTNDETAAYVKEAPDRFIGSFTVDIRDPMPAMREFRRCVEELDMKVFRLEPYQYGDGRTTAPPPTDRMYWPFYVACVEYDLPLAIQVGHTGPLLPSECGRPIYLDEVALTFPELKLIGTHNGDPWVDEMMILAWKHPNVFIESSARPARYWSDSLKKFAGGYGQDKMLWGTDYPLLPLGRTVDDVYDVGFSDEATRKILRDNAAKLFKIDD
ncbi:MAG: amidohydrolase family protein [Acidimicrobiia bacterium]|nr:MAG: amidohydrolase family protein [Acidimicrobiia bacterium]